MEILHIANSQISLFQLIEMKQENSKYIYFSSYFFFIFFLSSHLSAVERIIILERSVNNLSFSLSLSLFLFLLVSY